MTFPSLSDLSTPASVLALVEQLAKSSNGASSNRLTFALEDLRAGVEPDPTDAEWMCAGLKSAQARVGHWEEVIERLWSDGVSVRTCIDDDYPTNLGTTFDHPPALFIRGDLDPDDTRAVAIVGTRDATESGRALAGQLSATLADAGITILSGLAKGIDTAAHAACVNAGHRTVAVFGTTIDRIYPAANRGLADAIIGAGGAHVSQFLPGHATGPWSFPVRNHTMSGLGLGTIVVEAGETSGARIQAEAALAHGKHLYLVDGLVTQQTWAREMAERPNVTVTADPAEIIESVARMIDMYSGELTAI